ncbi:hypothetical protein CE91St30_07470 [Raoultibacter timonensis]|uniref:Uncharacterized protein n=1 Tax=Raoultibacter timonensis TaxID=1907662 RepID=A0ABM7WGS7_9ACTN|nr:hypothetical protein CE91St30_07470 [Raoultibacter timonensis]BDF50017.1 hypothetical protein CE91St31_07470 [Raoultibacter timonensis]
MSQRLTRDERTAVTQGPERNSQLPDSATGGLNATACGRLRRRPQAETRRAHPERKAGPDIAARARAFPPARHSRAQAYLPKSPAAFAFTRLVWPG